MFIFHIFYIMNEKITLSNEDGLKWIYQKWNELYELLCRHEITNKQYCIRRKSYESMMWELRHLMGENIYELD